MQLKNDLFFVIMKLNFRGLVVFLSFFSLIIIVIFSSTNRPLPFRKPVYNVHFDAKNIDCEINEEYSIPCKLIADQVYLPFSFLKEYYEFSYFSRLVNATQKETINLMKIMLKSKIYGNLVAVNSSNVKFKWLHSLNMGRLYNTQSKYDAKGVFMFFENYNVEARERVKCVTATDGVPLSVQWSVNGYYYPTQIAQFGLMHFSKNFVKNVFQKTVTHRKVIEDGDAAQADWKCEGSDRLERIFNRSVGSSVLKFDVNEAVSLDLQPLVASKQYFVLNFDLLLNSEKSRVSITLKNLDNNQTYTLNYVRNNVTLKTKKNAIFYGTGSESKWKSFSRNLVTDFVKGSQLLIPSIKATKRVLLQSISLYGSGYLDNLTVSQSVDHFLSFRQSADWFVQNQNERTGGWPNPVRKRFSNILRELKPGWHSAMAQGHALSLLSRALVHCDNDTKYMRAALNALKLFDISAKNGGIVNWFLDQFVWFEEYPTDPPSFVLNGFIYALIGLYDFKEISGNERAKQLYEQGMRSLKRLLPLFDLGWRSSYDLRHFGNHNAAPNVARWDYHLTHVNQLLVLSTIDNDPIFRTFSNRWMHYMKGKVAKHN